MIVRFNRDRFRGRTVWVLGGGPSLRGIDLDHTENLWIDVVIGCNDAYKFDCCRITCFGDNKWGLMHADAMQKKGVEVWTNNNHYQHHPWINWLRKCPHLSTRGDAAAWYGNTGYLGLQLALLGNPDRVILLGYDMQMLDGRSNWHDDNRGDPRPCDYVTMLKHNQQVVSEVKEKYPHVTVLNANPVSKLEGFEIVDPWDWGIDVPADHIYRSDQ